MICKTLDRNTVLTRWFVKKNKNTNNTIEIVPLYAVGRRHAPNPETYYYIIKFLIISKSVRNIVRVFYSVFC